MFDGKSKKSDTGPFPHQLIAKINLRVQRESKERMESEKTFTVGAGKAAAFSELLCRKQSAVRGGSSAPDTGTKC